jgi:hypothetical protein
MWSDVVGCENHVLTAEIQGGVPVRLISVTACLDLIVVIISSSPFLRFALASDVSECWVLLCFGRQVRYRFALVA